MSIYVCQGHEKGIGLEIFIKSFVLLSQNDQKKFTLAVDELTYKENLSLLNIDSSQLKNLAIHYLKKNDFPQTTKSLSYCLSQMKPHDILITLPTSKDQLIFNNTNQAGYTEFFRSYFNLKNISMIFKSFNENVLLITDHIPLSEVSKFINAELIENKLLTTLIGFKKYFYDIEEIYLAGINPHSGENGVLGPEEIILTPQVKSLEQKLNKKLLPFYSGDTLHFYQKPNCHQLFVYMYHDQGLAKFKAQNGLIGLNITFGLPFLRLSVDHGTAFNLYGKNQANLSGMIYLLKTALEVNSNVDQ
jgi:4-hydroxythreonine-4-phosphate dehydrogenase